MYSLAFINTEIFAMQYKISIPKYFYSSVFWDYVLVILNGLTVFGFFNTILKLKYFK